MTDIPIYSKQLCSLLNGMHPSTLREHIKAKKIPDFDVKLTQKTRYWHRSTLIRAGLLRDDQAEASQPTPASSDAVPA